MLDLMTVVKKSECQVSCVLDDDVAILNLDRAVYFGLTDVGAHIWDGLQEPRTVAEICEAVMTHFDVTTDACRADVSRFLVSLREAGLIEVVR
jgi:hypothetical protein